MRGSISIRRRLQILLVAAIVPLVAMAWALVDREYRKYCVAQQTILDVEYTTMLSEITHELQKERGMSAGYAASRGQSFATELAAQRDATAEVIERSRIWLTEAVRAGKIAPHLQSELHQQLSQLPVLQLKVDSFAEKSEFVPAYTAIVRSNLNNSSVGFGSASDERILRLELARQHLAAAKENAGLERAMVATALSQSHAAGPLRQRIAELRGAQHADLPTLLRLVPDSIKPNAEQLMSTEHALAAQGIAESIVQANDDTAFSAAPELWWKLQTKKLSDMHALQQTLNEQILVTAKQIAGDAFLRLWMVALAVSGVVSLVALFGAWSVTSISRRSKRIADSIARIACGQANLTERLEEGTDELGVISSNFNAVLGRLYHAGEFCGASSTSLTQAGSDLSQSTGLMAGNFQDSKRRSGEIYRSAADMNAAIDQISDTIATLTDSLGGVSQTMVTFATDMNRATGLASDASSAAADASKTVDESSKRIRELADSAHEIGTVVELIEDIAEKTNLLSLNATIEAAQAGDVGKGFAVVAGEVKQLATQTSLATDEIRRKIVGIRNSAARVDESITQISHAFEQLHKSTQSVTEMTVHQGRSAQDIRGKIESLTDRSKNARSEMDSTAQLTQIMSDELHAIDEIIDSSQAQVNQTRESGEEISRLATEMKRHVESLLNHRT